MQELIEALFVLLYKKGVINTLELNRVVREIHPEKPIEQVIAAINAIADRRTS